MEREKMGSENGKLKKGDSKWEMRFGNEKLKKGKKKLKMRNAEWQNPPSSNYDKHF